MPHIITTANVNGVRAAAQKGLLEWFAATEADVVCLQEVRATREQAEKALAPVLEAGWLLELADSSAKGRAGVAIVSRRKPSAVRVGFGDPEFAAAGRYIEADFDDLTVASLYLPSGEVDTPRQEEKERFMASFAPYLVGEAARVEADGRGLVVCGDWNIAHTNSDIKNWKTNGGRAGFLPSERAWLTELLAEETGWVDVVRSLHPGEIGPYSWWSYRGKAFDNDAGWRIDYQMATKTLAERAKSDRVERAASYAERWSDHAPVTVQYR